MGHEYSPVYSCKSTAMRNRAWNIGILIITVFFISILRYRAVIWPPDDTATAVHPQPNPQPDQRPQSPISTTSTSTLLVNQQLEDIILRSPSGQYQFGLEDSGELSLNDRWNNKTIFSSDTRIHLNATWHATLKANGILELSWIPTENPKHKVAWKSDLLTDCHRLQHIGLSALETSNPVLELHDSGLLQITASEKVLCTLSEPVEDKGHLAISYTGSIRTYLNTCDSHMEKIISQWTGSKGVDVHVFAYDEEVFNDDTDFEGEVITHDTVHNHLKTCYGDHLKTFSFVLLSTTSQNSAALPEDVVSRCHGPARTDQIFSQYYALYRTGHQIQKYMLQNAITYNYILHLRPDIIVKDAPQLEAVDQGKIVNIRPTSDPMYWGLHHDGSMHTGFTDIAVYGRASSMWTYFNIYTGLQNMLSAHPKWDWSEVAWIYQNKEDLGTDNRCNEGGILGYWLALNGLTLETEWRWDIGILGKDGYISQKSVLVSPS